MCWPAVSKALQVSKCFCDSRMHLSHAEAGACSVRVCCRSSILWLGSWDALEGANSFQSFPDRAYVGDPSRSVNCLLQATEGVYPSLQQRFAGEVDWLLWRPLTYFFTCT